MFLAMTSTWFVFHDKRKHVEVTLQLSIRASLLGEGTVVMVEWESTEQSRGESIDNRLI